jgi:serine/threonine-protein kinase
VGQALRSGVREDDDLTGDLALRSPPPRTEDTEPDPFDVDEFARVMAVPVVEPVADPAQAPEAVHRTTAIERRPVPPPAQVARITTARPPRRSRRGPLLLLLALLLVAGAGAGAWWFGWERYTSAPGVLGMAQKQAEKKLDAAGLDVEVGDPAYSETVPAGRVLGADPSAGARVLDGGTVTLVISLGKERYDVPVTEGLAEDAAQDRLLETHLAFGKTIGRWSETVEEGTVLRSDPPVGQTLRPGTVVDLFVSKGRKPLSVTDWTGKDSDEATTALERKGFDVTSTDEYSDSVPEGDVMSQSPTDGTLFRGEPVELVVSLGPELVEVPGGLVASGWESAQQTLEDAGFVVDVQHIDNYLGLGFVYSVDPGSGNEIPKGSTVTLWLI